MPPCLPLLSLLFLFPLLPFLLPLLLLQACDLRKRRSLSSPSSDFSGPPQQQKAPLNNTVFPIVRSQVTLWGCRKCVEVASGGSCGGSSLKWGAGQLGRPGPPNPTPASALYGGLRGLETHLGRDARAIPGAGHALPKSLTIKTPREPCRLSCPRFALQFMCKIYLTLLSWTYNH